jgi:CheY-like chemotaxis protein
MKTGLHGKLEELGLDEILQIVGVSRRTGILTLRSRGREAVLQFREGLLVRATSTGFQQTLGELLTRSGAATLETVQQALVVQQQLQFRERIGTILHRHFRIDLQVIEQTVREQIRNVLMTLFAWIEGDFDFSSRQVETVDAAYLDPLQLILELGDTAPDQLIAEGMRLQQELGADGGQEPVREHVPSPLPASEPTFPAFVIVDDDRAMAEAVADELKDRFAATIFTRSEEALVKVDALFRNGALPLVLVDLIMPKMDGTGVLGGLELIRLLQSNFSAIRIIVVSDFYHEDAVRQITDLGYPFFIKPRRGDTRGELFAAFLQTLKGELQQHG